MSRRCTNCGATVDVPPEALATACAFCDSPLVDVADGGEVPDLVVPFRVPGPGARDRLAKDLAGRWFAPDVIRTSGRVRELRSVYFPVWAYEAVATGRFDARVGIHWQRTETYTTTENGKTVTKTRTVTETEWFHLDGAHGLALESHLVSASRGLPEDECNALEPYDLGQAVPWDPARVAGHTAEHPTIPRTEAAATADAEVRALALQHVQQAFLPGDTASGVSLTCDVRLEPPRLVLVPVWIAGVHAGDHVLRLMVNGQTGEVVGAVPTSWVKVAGAVVLVLLVLAVGAGLIWLASEVG